MDFCVLILALTAAWVSVTSADHDVPPVADIKAGRLLGKVIESENFPRPVQAFLGVPYAQPPVGNLRLALPQMVTPWDGVRDATKYAAGCPQDEEMLRKAVYPLPIRRTPLDEDCLYLDVYTPDVKGNRDVLVLIHGGGFMVGKSSLNDGSAIVAFGDIVVVGISYRLGLFGFLQNDKDYWPQNLGLRDQQFALRWIRDNIAAFGGDPDRVTIGGASAGSASVSLHVVSPESRGLFHRAICQSGSLFTVSWTSKTDHGGIALQKLGCAGLDRDETLSCIRSKSVDEIMKAKVPVAVAVDGEVYPKDPIGTYMNADFPKVDMLIGVTGDEGYLLGENTIPALSSPDIDVKAYTKQLAAFLGHHYGNNADKIQEEIIDRYFGGDLTSHNPDFIRQQTAEILGYILLDAPTYHCAQLHADRGAKTFFYRYLYQPSFVRHLRPSWHSGGCDHGFELTFTRGIPLMMDLYPDTYEVTEDDIQMAKLTIQYWTNFVKTGNPNGEGLVEWKPFTRETKEYMILQPDCQQATGYKQDDMVFWNERIRSWDRPAATPRDEL